MNLEMIHYFAEAEFIPGHSWDELEAVYIRSRKINSNERLQFKEELLHIKKLLEDNQHDQIEKWLKEEMASTRLNRIELIEKFVQTMLPLIEKYEYKTEIAYVPLQAFQYMLETYITSDMDVTYFNVWEVHEEGDTFIAHFLKDIDYIESIFKQNDTAQIEKVLQISKNTGVYVLESEHRGEFLQFVKEYVD